MGNIIRSTVSSFTVGCMIFMLSLCLEYWRIGELAFSIVVYQYDHIVLGIFIVGLVGGGIGNCIYRLNLQYKMQVLLHYSVTIITVILVSIWLGFVSISLFHMAYYFALTSSIFFIIWLINYLNLVNDAKKINAILESRGK